MPKWTEEQRLAIEKSGSNIIVSAGAGSGKTAVLSERVIHKLEQGIKINELLILTFTNAAAAEMKERIRKKITSHEELKDNLDLLDSSYITTFDSYTLSLVKKYNYILGVSPNLSIIDSGIMSLLNEKYMDEVFDFKYEEKDPNFLKLINDFCVKNDKSLKTSILNIISKINLKSNRDEYLDNYLNEYYSDEKIAIFINEFLNLLKEEQQNIETNLMLIGESSCDKFYVKVEESLNKLLKAKTYDEFKNASSSYTSVRRTKDTDEIKEFKNSYEASVKAIKEYTRFKDEEELKEIFSLTKSYTIALIDIIKRFNEKINKYKNDNDLYEFIDIELMAINLLKTNEPIREELKKYYHEIMVDEYQDTSDLQEEFINLIENNNVYMVGDIKQSIYGFRNANPTIFKSKYDRYSKEDGGIKIDLLKNFRSRKEVLEGINDCFNYVMDDEIGGADYPNGHQMVFGNTNYEDNKKNYNYNLEIYNYNESEEYTKEEIESFIIGNDIKEKLKNGYEVIDKDTNLLRKASYKDFCIIMDRGTKFDIYSKVFEYLGIPLNIYEDKKLTTQTDILLLGNLYSFVLKVKENIIDKEFEYYFLSIARSYLYEYPDKKIFKIIKDNTYAETDIYKIADSIDIETLSSFELLEEVINKYNFYEALIRNGSINDSIIRIENLLKTADNLTSMGYSKEEFKTYLDDIIASSNEIKYAGKLDSSNSVKIMNIHKSKGLEFPICYFSGYHTKFNTSDIKERFVYNNKYGIITPYFKEGIGSTILKDLLKNKYNLDNISERIRLIYVALTRAKEKMIIITSLDDDRRSTSNTVDSLVRLRYTSFLDIINSISGNLNKYVKDIDVNNLELTKDYLYVSNNKTLEKRKTTKEITFHTLEVNNELVEDKHASKTLNDLITKDTKDTLEYGTYMHEVFERCDFNHLDKNDENYERLNNFKETFNIDENTKCYKEHEFIFESDGVNYHGIIDLVLVYDDEIKIVDYKLKNISDIHYHDQLKVYYNYLRSYFDKKITCYLYSIIDNRYEEVTFN